VSADYASPHSCARPPSAFFCELCLIPIRYPTDGELYTLCALSFIPYIRHVLRLDRHRDVAGDFFIPAFQCPHRVQHVSTLGDGGKWVCGLDRVAKQHNCMIYSFGVSRFVLAQRHPLPFPFAPRCKTQSSFLRRYQQRVLVRVDTIET
jgi:hypothetical protein